MRICDGIQFFLARCEFSFQMKWCISSKNSEILENKIYEKTIKFVALGLVASMIMGQTAFAAAGNHNIQALKLNPYTGKQNDAMVFANGVKNNTSGYTYSITNKTSGITGDDFMESPII